MANKTIHEVAVFTIDSYSLHDYDDNYSSSKETLRKSVTHWDKISGEDLAWLRKGLGYNYIIVERIPPCESPERPVSIQSIINTAKNNDKEAKRREKIYAEAKAERAAKAMARKIAKAKKLLEESGEA